MLKDLDFTNDYFVKEFSKDIIAKKLKLEIHPFKGEEIYICEIDIDFQ